MKIRQLTSLALRATLACGASAIAISLMPAASAQESPGQVYILRSALEVADGEQVLSTSSDIMMARHRAGDRSLLVYDVQNGALVIERGGETTVAPLVSGRGPELSFAYDYAKGELQGDEGTASVFNTWLRPVATTSPAVGINTSWAVATDLRALGVMAAGPAPIGFKLKRTYLQIEGKAVVLLEHEIPAFHYHAPGGESVVHWARGFAVVDTEFSQIFATGTQHRASATGADGEMRPISVRSSMHGIQPDGGWTLAFDDVPAVRAALKRVAEVSGDQIHPTAAAGDSALADPFPTMLASYLDMAAFAMAEGGANPLPVTSGAGSSPQVLMEQLGQTTGESSATMLQTLGLDPQQPADPAHVQAMSDFVVNPGTGLPPGLDGEENVQTYRPTASGSTLPNSGSVIMVVNSGIVRDPQTGSAYTVFTFPNGGSNAGQQNTGSTVFVFPNGGSDFQITPTDTSGSTVFYFSDGGGNQQGPSNGANVSSGSGEPATQRSRMNAYTTEAISAAVVSMVPGSATYSMGKTVTGPGGSPITFTPEQLALFESNPLFMPDPTMDALRDQTADAVSTSIQSLMPGSTLASYSLARSTMIDLTPEQLEQLRLVADQFTTKPMASTADELDALVSQMVRDQEAQRLKIEQNGQLIDMINNTLWSDRNMADDVINSLRGQLPPDQYDALLSQLTRTNDPRLQNVNLTGIVDIPGWMEPNSRDAEDYRRLVEELQRTADEIRRRLDGQTDKEKEVELADTGGFGDNADFYENNAFDYTSMVGIVPTDLSRWGEWLATQNVRELERLASLIGYPNLASALADAENIIRRSEDPGYRQWAMQAPSCGGYVGCGPNYLELWWAKQANVALGDILADSRDIFSSGGFSDIGISGLNLAYLLRDHALEDGDIVQIRITQFGRVIYEGQVNLTNAGEIFNLMVGRGVASLEIFAVNEGFSSPNTAQITVDNVVRGEATQTYSLQTGETATLRIEAGAKPAPLTGTSGGGQ